MLNPISGIRLPQAPDPGRIQAPGELKSQSSFQSALTQAMDQVSLSQHAAAQSVERFLSGEGEELHSVIMAQQRAGLSFDLFLEVRNKVVNAYQEVMRMPL